MTKKDPKISVIVPVYKVKQYLEKCVNSITNQTYKNLEIILIDDGSPDGSPALCDKLSKTDNRIKVIHKENGGVSSARNTGLANATGDYIAFVDSDDWIELETFEECYKKAKKEKSDIVQFDLNKVKGWKYEKNNQVVRSNIWCGCAWRFRSGG